MIADTAIRLASLADARPIARMSRDLIEHGLPWRWTTGRVQRSIRDPDTNVVVVDGLHEIAAFGIMYFAEEDAHLLLLAVRPGGQRRGLGSAVLRWLEEGARAAGAKRIRVESRRDNEAARSFYSEHGYHERTIHSAMYSGVLAGIRLEKWLRGDASSSAEEGLPGGR